MSGTRVNLLPRETEEREAGRRAMAGLAVVGLVFVAILVGLFFLQNSRVNDAEERLRAAEDRRAEVQAEVQDLQAYADLAQRRDTMLEVLTATMSTEVSLAGILQDVAAVMPNDAALTNMTVSMFTDPQTNEEFDLGGPAFGQLSASGETLRGHAPGVERFVIEFDKVAAFFNIYVSNSTQEIDEDLPVEITTFNIQADLGPEVFTARYLDGLPEGLR